MGITKRHILVHTKLVAVTPWVAKFSVLFPVFNSGQSKILMQRHLFFQKNI